MPPPIPYTPRGRSVTHMKQDAEGKYVISIVGRERNTPRALPKGSLLKLYLLSPNSRYFLFVGLFFMGIEAVLVFFLLHPGRYDSIGSSAVMMTLVGMLLLLAFVLPLVNARKIKRAIECGLSITGSVDSVQNARTTPYSTPEGMRNGSIRAIVSYAIHGQQYHSQVFLDRPWALEVERGTRLRLLVDAGKHTVLYVVGIDENGRM